MYGSDTRRVESSLIVCEKKMKSAKPFKTLQSRGHVPYVMISKVQWKTFWLATQFKPKSSWAGWQVRVNYYVMRIDPVTAVGPLYKK